MSDDKINHPAHKLACAFMANEYALNANHDLITSAPEYFKRNLKQKYKTFIAEFKGSQSEFDLLFNEQEQSTIDVYNAMDKFFKAGAKIKLYHMEAAAEVLEAFLIDSKSIEGIASKILKNKKC